MQNKVVITLKVTPHVGVWIETQKCSYNGGRSCVTPHVGVWIETPCVMV